LSGNRVARVRDAAGQAFLASAVAGLITALALALSPELPWLAGAAAMLALLPVLSPVVRRAQMPRESHVLAPEAL
jgi:hypothetical protein